MKRFLLESLGLSAAVVILHYMFTLHLLAIAAIWMTGLLLLPVVNRCIRRIHESEAEYYEMTAYMEQVLCSYKRWGTIQSAIEDCETLYPEENRMGRVIRQALHILKTGEGVRDSSIVESALAKIQEQYPSRRLRLLHGFLGRVQKMGGDVDESLDILLRDLQMWKRRVALYQKKKQFIRNEGVLAIGMALVLCCLSSYLMPWNLRGILTNSAFYQCSTTVVITLLMAVEVFMLYRLTGTWLDVRDLPSAKGEFQQDRNYRKVKGKAAGISGYMAKKVCRKEIEKEFPYWLLSVTLYLQQDSVYQAIKMSQEQVGRVFGAEVRRLLRAVYEDPVSLKPFTEFFQELEMPEVRTGMKILYSVNSNTYQDISRQIRFLVEQNNVVMDQCEQNHFANQTANMGLLKQVPMILASIKVVLDMVLLLLLTMGNYVTL